MGRVKATHQPEKSKRIGNKRFKQRIQQTDAQKKYTPRLHDLLPTEGFCWVSVRNKPFLTNAQSRAISKAPGMLWGPEYLRRNISLLFKRATQHINQCQNQTTAGFWGFVGSTLKWSKDLDGEVIFQFSLSVISARERVKDLADDYRDDGMLEKSQKVLCDTEMTAAVDGFTRAITETYSLGSQIGDRFYPPWTRDDFNEGDEDSTRASILQRIEEPNNPSAANTDADMVDAGDAGQYHEEVRDDNDDEDWDEDEDDDYDDDEEMMDVDEEAEEEAEEEARETPFTMGGLTMTLPFRPR
ncbi:hypothetical protein F4779DRAFT_89675 [Xylariaceae sp. FL0662B]|nr:hypothetical protein F4779DRAFT_89675 [Xylariaceae sp. FL0662B]